jgi:NAD(P)-dependent dehydrogenase (short-subunit alcohol dehydrogenase family)
MNLQERIVVITGASSGLGRATAHEFARKGARLTLAARHGEVLDHAAEECRRLGAEVLTVTADMTREDEVRDIATQTIEKYGGVDVWVNNAAVTFFSPLEDGSMEEHRGVLETNIFGYVHGARAVVPHFKKQGYGTLINVSSVLGRVGHPYVPSYSISKFADRGITEALRVELADYPDIHVCSVLPFSIDTPHFLVADNEIGRLPIPIPPVQSPEKVAKVIVRTAKHPRHERYVPRIILAGILCKQLFPKLTDQLLLHVLRRFHLGPEMPTQHGSAMHPGKIIDGVHGHGAEAAKLRTVLAYAALEAVRIEAKLMGRRLQRTVRLGR